MSKECRLPALFSYWLVLNLSPPWVRCSLAFSPLSIEYKWTPLLNSPWIPFEFPLNPLRWLVCATSRGCCHDLSCLHLKWASMALLNCYCILLAFSCTPFALSYTPLASHWSARLTNAWANILSAKNFSFLTLEYKPKFLICFLFSITWLWISLNIGITHQTTRHRLPMTTWKLI